MKSPGAPSHRQEVEREFWKHIATGVTHWIEKVYNRRRLHSAIGMLPPVEYEESLRRNQRQGESEELQATA